MNNSQRRKTAEATLQIIEAGAYHNQRGELVSIKAETDFAVENSRLFRVEDFPRQWSLAKNAEVTLIEVTAETTLAAAQRISAEDENPLVLNFASAKNPGGGFLSGAQAQEETLARSSSLYPCLMAHFEMYEANRKGNTCLYSDAMIYSPRAPVFRGDDGNLLDAPYQASFLTAPAVNAGAVKKQEANNVGRIETVNRERARKVFWIANHYGHQTLILGAWGCGVFGNEPKHIARIFSELLRGEFSHCFAHVVMAIYDNTPQQETYRAFQNAF